MASNEGTDWRRRPRLRRDGGLGGGQCRQLGVVRERRPSGEAAGMKTE